MRGLALWLALWVGAVAEAQVLSIDINDRAGETHEAQVALVRQAGATATSLSLFWDDLEPDPGRYAPAFDWPAIANVYYPAQGLDLTLTFSVIDTVADRRPASLQDVPWDAPEVTEAFAAHLRTVLGRMPDVRLLSISVGNEVDGHLAPEEVAPFARFVEAARDVVAELRPGVPVGTKITWPALRDAPEIWRPIVGASPALQVTYYPLTADFAVPEDLDVAADLDAMVALAGGRPVHILEAGYPSEGCRGSAEGQAAFVTDLLEAAQDRVALVSLTWLNDIPSATVDGYAAYYGVGSDCFRRYLGSLGLRDLAGRPKLALDRLLTR